MHIRIMEVENTIITKEQINEIENIIQEISKDFKLNYACDLILRRYCNIDENIKYCFDLRDRRVLESNGMSFLILRIVESTKTGKFFIFLSSTLNNGSHGYKVIITDKSAIYYKERLFNILGIKMDLQKGEWI